MTSWYQPRSLHEAHLVHKFVYINVSILHYVAKTVGYAKELLTEQAAIHIWSIKNKCIKVQSMNCWHTNNLLECYNLHSAIFWYREGIFKGTAFNECLLNRVFYIYHWCWSRDNFEELPSYIEWIRENAYIVNKSIIIQALLSHNHWLLNL